jgi:hypothetical protein
VDTNAREIEADLRKVALSQAAHDHRGNASATTVVADAETYFAFLAKALKRPEPTLSPKTTFHTPDCDILQSPALHAGFCTCGAVE